MKNRCSIMESSSDAFVSARATHQVEALVWRLQSLNRRFFLSCCSHLFSRVTSFYFPSRRSAMILHSWVGKPPMQLFVCDIEVSVIDTVIDNGIDNSIIPNPLCPFQVTNDMPRQEECHITYTTVGSNKEIGFGFIHRMKKDRPCGLSFFSRLSNLPNGFRFPSRRRKSRCPPPSRFSPEIPHRSIRRVRA